MDRDYQRGLLLSTVRGAFFLLNGVPRVGTCPISPSLQLLGVVVRTEKYGHVRHKALNAIMTVFPLDTSVFSVVLFCFSAFPALWNDMECYYRWQVASLILGYIHTEEDFPYGWGGIFPWAGPLAQCRHRRGPIGLLPPTINNRNLMYYYNNNSTECIYFS